jgi:class 3 adenylate cyclase
VPTFAARLDDAERKLVSGDASARTELAKLTRAPAPRSVRARALAALAIDLARTGAGAKLRRATRLVREAIPLAEGSRFARARAMHASGYVRYKRGESLDALADLTQAASLYTDEDEGRAQVFDTIGMYFQHAAGDLARASAYFRLSFEAKQRRARLAGLEQVWVGLAITAGNLGRVELARERFEDAERWFREDLELEEAYGNDPDRAAHVRGQLALALLGQGAARAVEARRQLDRALELAAPRSMTRVYLLKDRARVALREGDVAMAARLVGAGRRLVRGHHGEVTHHLEHVAALVHAARGEHRQAERSFRKAGLGFRTLSIPRLSCEVAVDHALAVLEEGRREEALEILVERALPDAEAHLFADAEPLGRIEALIESLDPPELMRIHQRRRRGGVPEAHLAGRLRGTRRILTVWTCDIRGFTALCDLHSGDVVVEMLNRFFSELGQPILRAGGFIDKYVGDNILAYFEDARAAAEVAIDAIRRTAILNATWQHLRQPPLEIGIGVATGDVVSGNVGFAGKLEHTIIGTAVNRACRIVGIAGAGQILVDDSTRARLGRRFAFGGARRVELKGLGQTHLHALEPRR